MSPSDSFRFLLVWGAVGVLGVLALELLKSSGRLSRSVYVGWAFAITVIGVIASGLVLGVPTPLIAVGMVYAIPTVIGYLLFTKFLMPRVWRSPGGANLDGLTWDQPSLLAVLRAEDPLMIAGQDGEDAVYSEAARLLDAAGPAASPPEQRDQLAQVLGEAVDDPGLVIPREVRRVSKVLRRLASRSGAASWEPAAR